MASDEWSVVTAIGTPVARATHGVIHLARVTQPDGSVMAMCGNFIVKPRTAKLKGPRCTVCEALR